MAIVFRPKIVVMLEDLPSIKQLFDIYDLWVEATQNDLVTLSVRNTQYLLGRLIEAHIPFSLVEDKHRDGVIGGYTIHQFRFNAELSAPKIHTQVNTYLGDAYTNWEHQPEYRAQYLALKLLTDA